MFKQIVLPVLGVVAFIAIVGIFAQKSSTLNFLPTSNSTTKNVTINDKKIKVEVSDTQEKRQKGLSGVKTLEINSGMLFIFDTQNVTPTFWMKDTLIPLDIVWINDARVVSINKNVPIPVPGTPDDKLPTYTPEGKVVDYVLEVNAGFADANNVKVGDRVDLSSI